VVYRVKVEGHPQVPIDDPVVLVANHVSYVDWLVIAASVKRPARFVMHYKFLELPGMAWLCRQAKVIPIASAKEDPDMLERAMEQIHAELQDSQVVCIFPEGHLTETGEIDTFRQGIERIVDRDPVKVIPVALNGLWGSFFSRRDGKALRRPFRRVYSRIRVTIGAPIAPADVTAQRLQQEVTALWSRHPDLA
jgi:hypothetical protein